VVKVLTLADRIKEVRKKAGLTQNDLAQKLEMTPTSIFKYEKGMSVPSPENIIKIARLGSVTADWLITGEDVQLPQTQSEGMDEFCYIPRYNIRAAAGHGIFNYQENVIQLMAFRRDFLKNHIHAQKENLFIITATGDSMQPAIHTGDILLCDKGRVAQLGEGMYVVRIDEALLVKNIQLLPGHKLEISSLNNI